MSGMTREDRTRLRALRKDVALPLRAERPQYVYRLADANGEYIGAIETEHSDDDEVHAVLIVDAVNALGPLLDDADDADERIAKAERERDEARARCRHAAQALIGEVGADGPLDVDEVAERTATVLRQLREEVERLRAIDREHCERLPQVRAAAREACAALCEDAAGAEESMGDAERAGGDDEHAGIRMTRASVLRQMAHAFRARGERGGM